MTNDHVTVLGDEQQDGAGIPYWNVPDGVYQAQNEGESEKEREIRG